MKNSELFGLIEILNKLGDVRAAKFNYFIAKNKGKVLDEIKALQEVINNSDVKYREFTTKRVSLNEKYCLKKEGKSVIENNAYKIDPENQAKFTEEINALRDASLDIINAEKDRMMSVNKLLDEECKIVFYKLRKDDIPAEVSGNDISAIMELIEQ